MFHPYIFPKSYIISQERASKDESVEDHYLPEVAGQCPVRTLTLFNSPVVD